MMEVRLVQLLGSFVSTTSAYTLARLEFAMTHADMPSPPLIERLPDASERTMRERWDRLEDQIEAARAYVKAFDGPRAKCAVYDRSFAWLQRTVREMEQYGRAVRWVMTVEEGR